MYQNQDLFQILIDIDVKQQHDTLEDLNNILNDNKLYQNQNQEIKDYIQQIIEQLNEKNDQINDIVDQLYSQNQQLQENQKSEFRILIYYIIFLELDNEELYDIKVIQQFINELQKETQFLLINQIFQKQQEQDQYQINDTLKQLLLKHFNQEYIQQITDNLIKQQNYEFYEQILKASEENKQELVDLIKNNNKQEQKEQVIERFKLTESQINQSQTHTTQFQTSKRIDELSKPKSQNKKYNDQTQYQQFKATPYVPSQNAPQIKTTKAVLNYQINLAQKEAAKNQQIIDDYLNGGKDMSEYINWKQKQSLIDQINKETKRQQLIQQSRQRQEQMKQNMDFAKQQKRTKIEEANYQYLVDLLQRMEEQEQQQEQQRQQNRKMKEELDQQIKQLKEELANENQQKIINAQKDKQEIQEQIEMTQQIEMAKLQAKVKEIQEQNQIGTQKRLDYLQTKYNPDQAQDEYLSTAKSMNQLKQDLTQIKVQKIYQLERKRQQIEENKQKELQQLQEKQKQLQLIKQAIWNNRVDKKIQDDAYNKLLQQINDEAMQQNQEFEKQQQKQQQQMQKRKQNLQQQSNEYKTKISEIKKQLAQKRSKNDTLKIFYNQKDDCVEEIKKCKDQ